MGDKEKVFFRELVSFNIVGLLNTGITYVIYALFVYIGIPYVISLILEYIFGIYFSFHANKKYTFRHKGPATLAMIVSMIMSYLGILILNMLLLIFFVEKMRWDPYVAQFLSLGITVAVSFLAQKFVVFRARRN